MLRGSHWLTSLQIFRIACFPTYVQILPYVFSRRYIVWSLHSSIRGRGMMLSASNLAVTICWAVMACNGNVYNRTILYPVNGLWQMVRSYLWTINEIMEQNGTKLQLKLLILFGIKRTSSIAMDNLVGCTFSFWNLKFFYWIKTFLVFYNLSNFYHYLNS